MQPSSRAEAVVHVYAEPENNGANVPAPVVEPLSDAEVQQADSEPRAETAKEVVATAPEPMGNAEAPKLEADDGQPQIEPGFVEPAVAARSAAADADIRDYAVAVQRVKPPQAVVGLIEYPEWVGLEMKRGGMMIGCEMVWYTVFTGACRFSGKFN